MIYGLATGAMDCTIKIHRKRRKRGTNNHSQIVCLFDIVQLKTTTTNTVSPSPSIFSTTQQTLKNTTPAKYSCI